MDVQTGSQVPQTPVSIPTKKRRHTKAVTALIVVILIAVALGASYHFNLIKFLAVKSTPQANVPVTSFSQVSNAQQALSLSSRRFVNSSAVNMTYNASIHIDMFGTNETIPAQFTLFGGGGVFRASGSVNMTQFLSLISKAVSTSSNHSNATKINSTVVNMFTFHNATGNVFCANTSSGLIPYNSLSWSCSYTGSSNKSLSPILSTMGPYLFGAAGNQTSSPKYIPLRYVGNSSYNGNSCALMKFTNAANYDYSGNICFSDSTGLPLYANISAEPTVSSLLNIKTSIDILLHDIVDEPLDVFACSGSCFFYLATVLVCAR